MAECMALEEVYRELLRSPLMRKISAMLATSSGSILALTSFTPEPSRPHCCLATSPSGCEIGLGLSSAMPFWSDRG